MWKWPKTAWIYGIKNRFTDALPLYIRTYFIGYQYAKASARIIYSTTLGLEYVFSDRCVPWPGEVGIGAVVKAV